ncbi:MAG: CHAT domain-containing protein [Blastocatellia bacterium]|nr:CHAT domain-containing protein [Blastocatellia bacterium]
MSGKKFGFQSFAIGRQSAGTHLVSLGLCLGMVAALFSWAQAAPQTTPQPSDSFSLTERDRLERNLASGEVHTYRLPLKARQYVRLVVEQKGVDVSLELLTPGQETVQKVDSPNGAAGPEVVEFVTDAAAVWGLRVVPLDEGAPRRGAYTIWLDVVRPATTSDRERVTHLETIRQKLAAAARLEAAMPKPAFEQAMQLYQEILPLLQQVNDQVREGIVLNNIGQNLGRLGRNQEALEYYNQALLAHRATKTRIEEAVTLNNIGEAYRELGDYPKASSFLRQALGLAQVLEDRGLEIYILSTLGICSKALGEISAAEKQFQQALQLSRAVGNPPAEANTLHNLGGLYTDTGDKPKALECYQLALAIERATNDRQGESYTLQNLAAIHAFLGETQQALDGYRKALQLARDLGDRHLEATTLSNIGLTYRVLGDLPQAMEFYRRAEQISTSINDQSGVAQVLQQIGYTAWKNDDLSQAAECLEKALRLFEASGERSEQALTLTYLGLIDQAQGALDRAQKRFETALTLQKAVFNPEGEAQTLTALGNLAWTKEQFSEAINHYKAALALRQKLKDRNGEAETRFYLARTWRALNEVKLAQEQIEAALTVVETQRTKVNDPRLRVSYFAGQQQYYTFYIDLLMQLHRNHPAARHHETALEIAERARSRSLLELLAESQFKLGGQTELRDRRKRVLQTLGAKEQHRLTLLATTPTDPYLPQLEQEITGLQHQVDELEAEIRAKNPHYASLVYPSPLRVRGIQEQVVDNDTILLEYVLGERQSYLWLVTPTTCESFELPGRAVLEPLAREVYQQMTTPGGKRDIELGGTTTTGQIKIKPPTRFDTTLNQSLQELSRLLLGPVAGKLGAKRLLIVADGALQYIPFGALPTPSIQGSGFKVQGSGLAKTQPAKRTTQPSVLSPLLVRHELITLPSASTLAILRREKAGRRPAPQALAVFADPVFTTQDERLAALKRTPEPNIASRGVDLAPKEVNPLQESQLSVSDERTIKLLVEKKSSATEWEIPRLPFTRDEARRLLALVPEQTAFSALNFQASKSVAQGSELSRYRVIHFATHGYFDSERPEQSAIILSLVNEKGARQDGFLRTMDIFGLNLQADLVVLSACKTGLGKEIRGEGLIGLTRGFMYAGAPAVVVSLWNVSDKATAELMGRFYEAMFKRGLRPAAALREAQLSLWQSKNWNAPFYWAAFQVQGEWW